MEKTLRSWRLFWLLALALSAANCAAIPYTDFSSRHGTESIILYSVRCALPLFLVAFTASSLVTLWPSRATRWLLANRRYFGLAFAFGLAWHLSFVSYSFLTFGNQLNATALTLDLIGLAFLLALTATSFRPVARHLSPRNWGRLHKIGVYAVWLLATYIYQGGARGDRDFLHFGALVVLVAAWLLRVAAGARTWWVRGGQPPLRGTPLVRDGSKGR